jgi:hypothetical protein
MDRLKMAFEAINACLDLIALCPVGGRKLCVAGNWAIIKAEAV